MNITLLERMILESLNTSSKEYLGLHQDTLIPLNIIKNIVDTLLEKELVNKEGDIISMDKNSKEILKHALNDEVNQKIELKEIIALTIEETLNHSQPKENFKLQKVKLTQEDFSIAKGLLKNLELLLKNAQAPRKNTSDQQIFFWGHTSYKGLVDNLLQRF